MHDKFKKILWIIGGVLLIIGLSSLITGVIVKRNAAELYRELEDKYSAVTATNTRLRGLSDSLILGNRKLREELGYTEIFIGRTRDIVDQLEEDIAGTTDIIDRIEITVNAIADIISGLPEETQ